MLTEIYMLFIVDLMIPHNGMNSINVSFRYSIQIQYSIILLLQYTGLFEFYAFSVSLCLSDERQTSFWIQHNYVGYVKRLEEPARDLTLVL